MDVSVRGEKRMKLVCNFCNKEFEEKEDHYIFRSENITIFIYCSKYCVWRS